MSEDFLTVENVVKIENIINRLNYCIIRISNKADLQASQHFKDEEIINNGIVLVVSSQ